MERWKAEKAWACLRTLWGVLWPSDGLGLEALGHSVGDEVADFILTATACLVERGLLFDQAAGGSRSSEPDADLEERIHQVAVFVVVVAGEFLPFDLLKDGADALPMRDPSAG